MADLQSLETEAMPWKALEQACVIGARLLRVADWIVQSSLTEASASALDVDAPRLVLPSIQRSAVWRPRQVLDFWDSVLRGLPVGAFYVMRSSDLQEGRRFGAGDDPNKVTVNVQKGDYLLLDGQQRLRALLAGLAITNDDKRCIWIDLSKIFTEAPPQVGAPFLFLTSQAQPFGYDNTTGAKLPTRDRVNARQRFSESSDLFQNGLHVAGLTNQREAYDHELFTCDIELKTTDGVVRRLATPPKPYKTCPETTVRLAELFQAWLADPDHVLDKLDQRSTGALRIDPGSRDATTGWLRTVFTRLEKAQVALILADVADEDRKVAQRNISALFTRIGAGGTVLSPDERLYSIYKHYVPDAHRLVEAVRDHAGRILPAVRIAGIALRIAQARARIDAPKQYRHSSMPDEEAFITAVTEDNSLLSRHLEGLMRPDTSGGDGPLAQAFLFLRHSVRGASADASPASDESSDPFWIPDVLLASLPAELWEVLAFWAVQHGTNRRADQSRQEIVRFILFWLLCVENNEKASALLFEAIAGAPTGQDFFPGQAFYHRLVRAGGDKPYVLELIQPDAMHNILVHTPENDFWVSWKERFERTIGQHTPDNRAGERLAAHWWDWNGGGRRMLPWLQRDYIAENFQDYVPLGIHEDDLPYDVDHICAHKNWGSWWEPAQAETNYPGLSEQQRRELKDNRHVLGNGIGNLQLLGARENRKAQAIDFQHKPWTNPGSRDEALWERVSRPDGKTQQVWDKDRRAAFQQAVEKRAAWLYQDFFTKLGYGSWLVIADQAAPTGAP